MTRAPNRPPVTLTCEHCRKLFTVPYSTSVMGNGRRFCSNACYLTTKDRRPTFACETCGKVAIRTKIKSTQGYNYKQRFCSRACQHESQRKGGYVHRGYRIIHVNGRPVAEHRHVVEQAIGRYLSSEETVHHVSGDKLDNRYPENLEIWSGRHGKGQRAFDHVAFAVETLKLYPELLTSLGYRLLPLESAASSEILGKPPYHDFDASEVIRRVKSMAT